MDGVWCIVVECKLLLELVGVGDFVVGEEEDLYVCCEYVKYGE